MSKKNDKVWVNGKALREICLGCPFAEDSLSSLWKAERVLEWESKEDAIYKDCYHVVGVGTILGHVAVF